MYEEEPLDAAKRLDIGSSQFSLFEIFYATTLAAIAMGIYMFISPLLALTAGGSLLVLGIVRWTGCRNLIFGGLVGFLSATIVSWLIIVVGRTDMATSIGLALLCPAAGYIVGACFAELSDDGSI